MFFLAWTANMLAWRRYFLVLGVCMLDSVMYLSEKPNPAHAPPKTSMEPENEALEEDSFRKPIIFRFHAIFCRGVLLVKRNPGIIASGHLQKMVKIHQMQR